MNVLTSNALVKLSDYVASFLANNGIRHVFMLTGGGSMHLNDSLGFEPNLKFICNHHEQACAIAAEGYARIAGRMAAINVTTGPGGINALNGVFCAWTDSIPMLVLSGQVRRDTVLGLNPVPGLRQLGDQEVDIIGMVKGITKYATLVSDPATIRYHLEKALHLATTGRQGPVWLDIPIDVQGSRISPTELSGFTPSEEPPTNSSESLADLCRQTLARIAAAKRPVIMVGSGVRLAKALPVFERVIRKLGIPVTTAWTAIDAIASDDPLYCGRPGAVGDRAGNFTVQNADVLLVVGTRLPIRQVSYNWRSFARAAYKIFVDIDPAELDKPMSRPDLPVVSDARLFFEELERQIDRSASDPNRHSNWVDWCKARVQRYPVLTSQSQPISGPYINPYLFVDRLFECLAPDDVVVCGDATASVVAFQAAKIKAGQRVFTNAGCATMGYDLPAAIGAAVAREGRRVICLAGDGSLQLNIQELQTVVHHRLPIKLFVLNNNGYLSMRLTQGNFFKRFVGESSTTGVSFPDMMKVGAAYGLPTVQIQGPEFQDALAQALAMDGPVVCDVLLDPNQAFEPKLSSRQLPDGRIVSASLEDMSPFLPPEELAENLLIPQQKE